MGTSHTIHDEPEGGLEARLREDPALRPVYLRVERNGDVTELSLSREGGERIYCAASEVHEDLLEHFRVGWESAPSALPKDESPLRSAKRAKQGSLFSFIKK